MHYTTQSRSSFEFGVFLVACLLGCVDTSWFGFSFLKQGLAMRLGSPATLFVDLVVLTLTGEGLLTPSHLSSLAWNCSLQPYLCHSDVDKACLQQVSMITAPKRWPPLLHRHEYACTPSYTGMHTHTNSHAHR